MSESNKNLSVSLSAWEWHNILSELEHLMCIVNRDQSVVKKLYTKISTQLSDCEVKFED